MNKNELQHHGVKGMKWGIINENDDAKSRVASEKNRLNYDADKYKAKLEYKTAKLGIKSNNKTERFKASTEADTQKQLAQIQKNIEDGREWTKRIASANQTRAEKYKYNAQIVTAVSASMAVSSLGKSWAKGQRYKAIAANRPQATTFNSSTTINNNYANNQNKAASKPENKIIDKPDNKIIDAPDAKGPSTKEKTIKELEKKVLPTSTSVPKVDEKKAVETLEKPKAPVFKSASEVAKENNTPQAGKHFGLHKVTSEPKKPFYDLNKATEGDKSPRTLTKEAYDKASNEFHNIMNAKGSPEMREAALKTFSQDNPDYVKYHNALEEYNKIYFTTDHQKRTAGFKTFYEKYPNFDTFKKMMLSGTPMKLKHSEEECLFGDILISELDDNVIEHAGKGHLQGGHSGRRPYGMGLYVNPDGTLTEAGKNRYYKNSSYERKAAINDEIDKTNAGLKKSLDAGEINEEQFKKGSKMVPGLAEQKLETEWLSKAQDAIQKDQDKYAVDTIKTGQSVLQGITDTMKATTDAIPNVSGKDVHPDYSDLSTEELKARTDRLNAENNYARASGQLKHVPSSQEKAREKLQTIGAVSGILATVIGGVVIPLARHKYWNGDGESKKK